jgi:hypothetical protein
VSDIHAAKRLGVEDGAIGDGRHGWWVSHSPRNGNSCAEGQWCQWVHLARLILAHDRTREFMPDHHQPYPDPPRLYDECHPDCEAT